jgi:hypothetical protein
VMRKPARRSGKPTLRNLVRDAQERATCEEALQSFVRAGPKRRLQMWATAVAQAAADELRKPEPADDQIAGLDEVLR